MKHITRVVGALVFAHFTGQAIGCMVAKSPNDVILEQCAGEARAEYYVGDASVDQAMRVYEECLARHGVR